MNTIIQIIKYGAALAAAMLLGHWFLAEARRLKEADQPLYKVYFTIPGIMVILLVTAGIIFFWFFGRG